MPVTRKIRGWVSFGLLLFAMVGGCRFKGGRLKQQAETDGPVWHPHPVHVRIYPSTRFATGAQGPLLEAKVELLDAMGDTIKAPGAFRIELYTSSGVDGRAAHDEQSSTENEGFKKFHGGARADHASDRGGGGAAGRRLYSWRVPVRTLAQQREFFDSVTRVYALRLQVESLALKQPRLKLQVTFLPVNGPLLQTRGTLTPRSTPGSGLSH